MIRLLSDRRRLLRKGMYRSPHKRHRVEYIRGNPNLVKSHQSEFKNSEIIIPNRRPKREVQKGFKMSYRYKYYNVDFIEEEDDGDL